MADRPSGAVTFLFTDIEGSTRLWEEHRTEMSQALRRHDEILLACIAEHGGVVFSTGGDGFGAAFAMPGAAVGAAVCAQEDLDAAQWPTPSPLRVRMGLHVGVTEERNGNYFGPPVNRAARVMAAAHGGQVVATASALELVADDALAGVPVTDLGEHRLKDLLAPERIFQIGAGVFSSLRTLQSGTNNLPTQRTELLGRDADIGEVAELVAAHRLVTLTGFGGTGKTRLALAVAALETERFLHGVFFVDLASVEDGALIAAVAADAVGVSPSALADMPGAPFEQLAAALADRDLLLVMDNCEHVIDGAVEFVDALLDLAPRVRVLATSREALEIDGEHQYRVKPLPVGDTSEVGPAIDLFVRRATAAGATVSTGDPAVAVVCRHLDGLPLAIELAAARCSMMQPADLEARLGEQLALLTSRRRRGRHRSLESVLEWSWDLLDTDAQALLVQLGVFVGGWSLHAAEGVCELGTSVAQKMQDLVAASLIETTPTAAGVRFHMLEPVRQFAVARLELHPDRDALEQRHLIYWLNLGRERSMSEQWFSSLWARRISQDFENYRKAVVRAFDRNDHSAAAELLTAATATWLDSGKSLEGAALFDRALANGEPTSRLLIAAAFNDIGVGAHARLAARVTDAVSRTQGDDDKPAAAMALCTAGFNTATINPDTATQLALTAIDTASGLEDADLRCIILTWGAVTLHIAGDHGRAMKLVQQALDLPVVEASIAHFHCLIARSLMMLDISDLDAAHSAETELVDFTAQLPDESTHRASARIAYAFRFAQAGRHEDLGDELELHYAQSRATGRRIGFTDVVLAIAESAAQRGNTTDGAALIAALHRQPLTHPLVYHRYRNLRDRLPDSTRPDRQLDLAEINEIATTTLSQIN